MSDHEFEDDAKITIENSSKQDQAIVLIIN